MRLSVLALLAIGLASPAIAEVPCGVKTGCPIPGGAYRIAFPADGDVRGAFVYFHGWKGSADLQMEQRPLVAMTLAHHLAYVAVDGIDGGWSFPGSPSARRDEKRFIGGLFDDLRQREHFTPDRIVIGGFSIGASMAWYTACQQGEKAAGMVTFSGVFWDPLPKASDCVSDVPPMVHFHGSADTTFPLAGRAIGKAFHQGDAFKSLAIMRQRSQCDVTHARQIVVGGVVCDDVPGCLRGDSIMCVHNRGHEAGAGWLDAGLTVLGFPK
ncbi:polyhydroxybutyrate depolymerase [Rhizobium sp. 9140]|nr:polyhydroxybutyrate depolymerase [Rhizobium sp. 9140]